jgi:long-chain acyl-CoA synthetase
MLYTSGTTGRPKGVLREVPTPEQAAVIQRIVGATLDLRPGDRTLIPAPLYHSAPNVHSSVALAMGIPLTLMDRFDAEQFLALVERDAITHTQMVPTMLVRLLQLPVDVRARYDVSSLRSVVHAAAPCPSHVKQAMIEWWGPIIGEYYGGTESGPVVSSTSHEWLAHPGTVGKPVETGVVKIRRADGSWAVPLETGDIYVRLGCWPDFTYHGDPAKRAGAEHEGLITVGDIGHLDADGYLYLTDRQSDVVITGGVNLYPAEVEAALLTVPGIKDCAAFGIPDEAMGEILIAHVEVEPGVTEDDIRKALDGNLATFKLPRRFVFDDALPREASGKLLKRRLRELYT